MLPFQTVLEANSIGAGSTRPQLTFSAAFSGTRWCNTVPPRVAKHRYARHNGLRRDLLGKTWD
jgi:hypothetical protein